MLKIGLTGGIGCGKSLVAGLFAQKGVPIIDTDNIAHQLTAADGAAMPILQAAFGAEVVAIDGALDRPKMRALVFADEAVRKQLEAILHPLIRQRVEALLTEFECQDVAYVMIDVPLLFESGIWQKRVDRVLVVDCSESLQIERVMARNAWTTAQVERVMAAQVSRATRLTLADDVLDNQGDLLNAAIQVDKFHESYLALAANAVCKK